jgi:hypothetical protein
LLKIEANLVFTGNEPAIWVPGKYDYSDELKNRYKDLGFNRHTNWGDFVDLLQSQY